jgi:hypothetical protein
LAAEGAIGVDGLIADPPDLHAFHWLGDSGREVAQEREARSRQPTLKKGFGCNVRCVHSIILLLR